MFFIVCFGVLGLLKTADEPFSRIQLIFLPAGLYHILMAAHLLAGDILFLNSMAQCSTGSSKIRVYIMLGTNFVAAVCMAWAKWKGVLASLQDDPGVEDIVPNTLAAFPHHAVHKFFSGRASCSTRITRADTIAMVKLIMVWANITAVTFIVKLNWGADTLLGTHVMNFGKVLKATIFAMPEWFEFQQYYKTYFWVAAAIAFAFPIGLALWFLYCSISKLIPTALKQLCVGWLLVVKPRSYTYRLQSETSNQI
jgi:hypothetical protein